jgi:hypothetical protein
MEIVGVISADIIGSTSIDTMMKIKMMQELKKRLRKNDKEFNTYSKISGGDKIEIIVYNISQTMRIALALKAIVKALSALVKEEVYEAKSGKSLQEKNSLHIRHKYFKSFGVRMAIEINKMDRIDEKKGVLEGQAIYNAGRRISNEYTHTKERVVIKSTITFGSFDKNWEKEFQSVFGLIDFIFSKLTARQCEILAEKLKGKSDDEIKRLLNISQPAVNQMANNSGWREISAAIVRFESIVRI